MLPGEQATVPVRQRHGLSTVACETGRPGRRVSVGAPEISLATSFVQLDQGDAAVAVDPDKTAASSYGTRRRNQTYQSTFVVSNKRTHA
jgi:hypothetical protein